MVVDPQVDRDVVEAAVPRLLAHHEECGGLPAPPVTPGVVAGRQRREQPASQRSVDPESSQAACIARTTSSPVSTLPWMA